MTQTFTEYLLLFYSHFICNMNIMINIHIFFFNILMTFVLLILFRHFTLSFKS
jgi:hypothetical protein